MQSIWKRARSSQVSAGEAEGWEISKDRNWEQRQVHVQISDTEGGCVRSGCVGFFSGREWVRSLGRWMYIYGLGWGVLNVVLCAQRKALVEKQISKVLALSSNCSFTIAPQNWVLLNVPTTIFDHSLNVRYYAQFFCVLHPTTSLQCVYEVGIIIPNLHLRDHAPWCPS